VALADGVQATAVADKDGVGVEPGKEKREKQAEKRREGG
jgi:hypothetical protein